MIKQLLIGVVSVALLVPALPAAAADTVTISGSVDFTGTTVASHVTITAFGDPTALVARESLASLATASVDFVPGGGAQPFTLTVPAGSKALLNFDPTTTDGLVDEWWVGAGATVAGAYPVLSPITQSTDLGSVHAIRTGTITAELDSSARETCVLRLDHSVVQCTPAPSPSTSLTFAGLYPGKYLVTTTSATVELPATVTEGTFTNVSFSDGGTIVGTVKNSKGKRLAGVQVWTTGTNGNRISTKTDSRGRYELNAIEGGIAELYASDGVGGYVNLSGAYGPLRVRVGEGFLTDAPDIILNKAGAVTFTPKASRADVISVLLMKGTRVYDQLELDYRSGISRGAKRLTANPGTYKLVTIDRNGKRLASSTKITLREGKTLKLGSVVRTKSTFDVSGTAPGVTGSIRLHTASALTSNVIATAKVVYGEYTVRSVPRGVYWVQYVDFAGRVSDLLTRITVTKDSTIRVLTPPRVTNVYAGLALNGRNAVGATLHLAGDPFIYAASPIAINEAGGFLTQWYGYGAGTVRLESRALGTNAPYYFVLNYPAPTFEELNGLIVTGIGGGA